MWSEVMAPCESDTCKMKSRVLTGRIRKIAVTRLYKRDQHQINRSIPRSGRCDSSERDKHEVLVLQTPHHRAREIRTHAQWSNAQKAWRASFLLCRYNVCQRDRCTESSCGCRCRARICFEMETCRDCSRRTSRHVHTIQRLSSNAAYTTVWVKSRKKRSWRPSPPKV